MKKNAQKQCTDLSGHSGRGYRHHMLVLNRAQLKNATIVTISLHCGSQNFLTYLLIIMKACLQHRNIY